MSGRGLSLVHGCFFTSGPLSPPPYPPGSPQTSIPACTSQSLPLFQVSRARATCRYHGDVWHCYPCSLASRGGSKSPKDSILSSLAQLNLIGKGYALITRRCLDEIPVACIRGFSLLVSLALLLAVLGDSESPQEPNTTYGSFSFAHSE